MSMKEEMERANQKLKNDAQAVRALHQWLKSQEIEREDWGPIFAMAAGHEVLTHCQDKLGVAMGLMILEGLMDKAALTDIVNA